MDSTGFKCPACGYDLTALTRTRCPECGEVFEIARPGGVRQAPADAADEVNPVAGVLQGFFGLLLGVGWADPRQSIWAVGSGMLAAAAVVLLIVWIVSR